jgi:microcystin-dependent protein
MPIGTTYLSQIALFGFNFAPQGWAFCSGQLLPISQNQALFALLGTQYGGNGTTTFALPDLRGRAPMGFSGVHLQGEIGGAEAVTLAAANMPAHTHTIDTTALSAAAKCKNGTANQWSPVATVPAIETSGTTTFTDDPLTAGSSAIRAVHVTELRARIDAVRAGFALPPFDWTDPVLTAGTTGLKAQHILDMRTALLQAYANGGLVAPTFTDPALGAGTAIKAVHIAELRSAAVTGNTMIYSSAPPDADMNSGSIVIGAVTAATAGLGQPHENRMPFLTLNYCIALQGIFPSHP